MMLTMMGQPLENENSDGVLVNSLTKREKEILKLVAEEFTTKEISEKLFISVSTVESHRKNLIKKLNVKNSIGLALFAMEHHIV
jgi:DNA-binding NarL/FixJ family response regulator